ncbi:hypothetical protein FOZ60_013004 [Perkinsus olseni]|uniref:RING-type domain-containing protein n=1 Tax=Perkinsus olseni TaxID=32597 RepID=A0A7J6NAB8_PEROL|nr:hypothetical protein FOZ60_013004 [Perkinsus olseni]
MCGKFGMRRIFFQAPLDRVRGLGLEVEETIAGEGDTESSIGHAIFLTKTVFSQVREDVEEGSPMVGSVPLVSSSKKEGADFAVDGVEIECGNCRASTRIPEEANNFLCESCKSVNRVTVYPLGDRGVDVVEEPSCTVPRQRGANHGLQLAGDSSGVLLPCSICLDRPGDCVLLPCNHGGFCQVCSIYVGCNLAVGGRHCPKCREYIEQIIRIGRIHEMELKGNPVAIPMPLEGEEPPEAAAPVGMGRSKGEGRQKAPRRGPTTTTIASSSNNSPNPSVVGDDEKMSKTPRDESASDVVPRAIAFEETPPSKVEDTPDRADPKLDSGVIRFLYP